MEDIFNIKQRRDETLRKFVHHFQKHRNTLPQIEDKWAGIAFRHALHLDGKPVIKDLAKHLVEYPAKIWDDIYYQYCSKIRIEQDIISPIMRKSLSTTKDTSNGSYSRKSDGGQMYRSECYDPYYSRGTHEGTRRNNQYWCKSSPAAGTCRRYYNTGAPKLTDHNFCVSTSEVVAALDKLGNRVKWPGKMKSDPSKRNPEHFCEFHKGHGHKIEDCHALRLAVAELLEQRHLTKLLSEKVKQAYYQNRDQEAPPQLPEPKRVVNFITGGIDVNITGGLDVNKVTYTSGVKFKRVTTRSEKRDRLTLVEDCITFDEADVDNMQFPHNDGLVITLRILDTNIKRFFVDQGSTANIINIRVIEEMKLTSKIIHKSIMLTGFNNSIETTPGEVILPVVAGGIELQTIFSIMSSAMAYNMIVGRPWIHAMKAVPSTYH
ncbi:uncharacterized protein LOC132611767 [Lycium barbarum]|uniref:uncharacterized protein LOC132611767 n=1 Tax=Lycium barbarum TaxID=112863 RepID=UPI00293E8187|nr:uncharacterized protein LOC132611767 [Lycium barbarum]